MKPVPPTVTILGFLDFLKDGGFSFGIPESTDILATIGEGNLPDRSNAYHAIRALVCRSLEEWQVFDLYFRKYWFPDEVRVDELDVAERIDPRNRNRQRLSGLAGASKAAGQQENPNLQGVGAGTQRNISKADFRFINDKGAMRRAEQVAEQLATRLKRRLGRRRCYKTQGSTLDIRRTLRRSLVTGGLPVRPVFSVRKPTTPRLVLFHDVSHSMTWNNPMLFRFARGLVRSFPGSEAFAFHTRLFVVTDIYREQSLTTMRQRLEDNNRLWMGGTRIAESLLTFNSEHGLRIMTPKTIVIIISDGIDTDGEESLQRQLDCLAANSKSIIWMNPMLGRAGVSMSIEKLQQRLPQVDAFMPANSLDNLRATINRISLSI